MTKASANATRLRLIKIIHVARRELGMDESTYRLMLGNLPGLDGATSSAKLTIPQLRLVLDGFKKRGFKVRPKGGPGKAGTRKMADDNQSKLIRHLWLELHSAGAVRDPSEQALAKFASKMTKVGSLQWLSSQQASQVIENLKNWLHRIKEGADDE